ncbi:tetratricopeptide repeat protein [Geminocystis sp. NIES-3709]|uniref:tetratricopeptide repeat protein n=1 Tax=Geminocystis sp. NIES-3709 TaxID=1617448 RepID=UPI0005FCA0D6|nr:tetratricopeptide repeat protein [Geminocystis sp. NIES-3709]BAQ66376.1 WD-40 repeat protein [Geminocystis sp. NIES-3709]
MIPTKFLQNITKHFGITEGESEVLSRAIQGESVDDIAKDLGISKDALQKRLGEVYKKFQIFGFGPGKLAKLQQRLVEEYQKYRQNQNDKSEILTEIENDNLDLPHLSEQEQQLLYVLLLNKEGINLSQIQSDIFPNISLGEVLIMVGKMLKDGLLQEKNENQENKFILGNNIKVDLEKHLKFKSKLIIENPDLDNLTLSNLWQKLSLIHDEKNLPNDHILNKELGIYFNDRGYDAYLLWELNTAQKYFLTALKFDENLPNIYYNLGLVYEKMQQWESAINYFQQGFEQNLNYQALVRVTDIMILQGEIDTVKEKIISVLEKVNNEEIKSKLLTNLGYSYFLSKDNLKAREYIEISLAINPNLLISNYLMAEILEEENKEKEALKYWQNCLDLNSENKTRSGLELYGELKAKLRLKLI